MKKITISYEQNRLKKLDRKYGELTVRELMDLIVSPDTSDAVAQDLAEVLGIKLIQEM